MRFHIVHLLSDLPAEHGLHGYQEVIETIQWGLSQLGHEVSVQVNGLRNDCINIVFGPQMLNEVSIPELPPGTIVYNLEQLARASSSQIKPAYHVAARYLRVWDYSEPNLESWRQLGAVYPPVSVPIGFAPVLARIPKREDEDIDVLFYGMPNETRLRILAELCEAGLRCVFACGLYGTARDTLIARAKIVLNLNMLKVTKLFEVVRVSYLLANAKAVVSDIYPDTFVEPDLRAALAFAPPERLCATCLHLLHNESARRQLEQRGREIIQKRDIQGILRHALTANLALG